MQNNTSKNAQERGTICRAHGLRYDARSATGCVRCRQDNAAAERGSRNRSFQSLLLALLLIGVIAGVGYWRGPAIQEALPKLLAQNFPTQTQSATTSTQTDSFEKIDPEPAREEIETLEAMLYGQDKSWI